MAQNKKVTKAQRFSDIRAILNNEPTSYGTTVDEANAFIDNELVLLARKNSPNKTGEPTEKQKANAKYKEAILDFLANRDDGGVTATLIFKSIPELYENESNQKVTRLLSELKDEGRVAREVVKGKALFALA